MKRYLYVALFAIVLLAPLALRRTVGVKNAGADVSAANAPRLVIITPHNRDIRQEFARAFSQWHQGRYGSPVALDFRAIGGTDDIRRVLSNEYDALRDANHQLPSEAEAAQYLSINLVFGGGDTFFDELKQKGVLAPVHLSQAQLSDAFPVPSLGGVNLYDPARDDHGNPSPAWVGVCLSSFGIMYNPDVYASIGLPQPQTWTDLTRPELNGLIGLADPTRSGSVAVCYMMVIQRAMADAVAALPAKLAGDTKSPAYLAALAEGFHRGMGTLLLMAANARYFEASATLPPQDVANGDVAAATVIDFYARVTQENVGPRRARYVVPTNATAITPDPIAILYGTVGAQRVLADHLIEFLLSPQGQRLWILKPGVVGGPINRALRRTPIRRDIFADRTNWTDDVDPFAQASAFNMHSQWMTLFADVRPIWAAAWIDDRDALKSAYATILAVPDDTRRKALIAELADVPLTMAMVQDNKTQRKQHEAAGDADRWNAQRRIAWAQTFAEHYQRVAEKAR